MLAWLETAVRRQLVRLPKTLDHCYGQNWVPIRDLYIYTWQEETKDGSSEGTAFLQLTEDERIATYERVIIKLFREGALITDQPIDVIEAGCDEAGWTAKYLVLVQGLSLLEAIAVAAKEPTDAEKKANELTARVSFAIKEMVEETALAVGVDRKWVLSEIVYIATQLVREQQAS